MISLASVQGRVRRRGWASLLKYSTLRFWSVRTLLVALKKRARSTRQSLPVLESTVFPGHDVDAIVKRLGSQSYYAGFALPTPSVREIRRFAEDTPAVTWMGSERVEFSIREREAVERRHGRPVIIAKYSALECPAVRALKLDPLIHEVAARYLGYRPRRFHTKLIWSFVCDASVEARLHSKQTLRFHYDLHASRSLCFNFYLTDVDDDAGPHVVVPGSHGPKSFAELLSRTGRSDEYIERKYGPSQQKTLCGPAGFGFVEDHFCYHKATVPLKRDRLMLMLHVS